MTGNDFRRRLDAIWKLNERKHKIKPVARELRRMVERKYLTGVHDADDGLLADIEGGVVEFIQDDLPVIVLWAQREAANPRAERLPDSVKLRGRTRRYQKPFERRLRIVDFVAQRQVPFAYLVQREFDTAGRRVDWKRMSDEWNKTHPDDKMDAEPLRVMYERAKREEYLRQMYFDRKFRDWAKHAGALRPMLNWLEDAGLRPEDVFVKAIAGQSTRLLEEARRLLERAQALRRANEAEDIDSAARERNEELARGLEASAQPLTRASQVKEWSGISVQLSPGSGSALARAVRRNCGLTEGFVAYPRGTVFCERQRCHRCKFGADLLREGFIAAPRGLRPSSAKGAGERHRQSLDESARVMQRLLKPFPDSRRSGQRPDSG
ncbi:MAG: hypothetical protein ABSD48_02745 [Armatimonadota bacterium]|jgi:hypothetical protein